MVITLYNNNRRVWINRVRLPILLLVVSWVGKMSISLSPFAPENYLVSRGGFGRTVPSACLLIIIDTQAESGTFSRDSSLFPRRRPLFYATNRHRLSPEFFRSPRICVTMMFTAGCRDYSDGHRPTQTRKSSTVAAAAVKLPH